MRGIAGNYCACWNIPCHHSSCPHDRCLSYRDTAQDRGSGANGRSTTDIGLHDLPVGPLLRQPRNTGSSWKLVIGEAHAMPDETIVLDMNTFTYEGMTGYLASVAYGRVFLNLDKGSYPSVITYFTAIQVYKGMHSNVLSQDHIICDANGWLVRWHFSQWVLLDTSFRPCTFCRRSGQQADHRSSSSDGWLPVDAQLPDHPSRLSLEPCGSESNQ